MNKQTAIALSLLAATGVTMAGHAGETESNAGIEIGVHAKTSLNEQFKTLDSDGDGVITPQEAKANARLQSDFDKLDGNGDDELTRDEFITGLKARNKSAVDEAGNAIGSAAASVKSGVVTGAHKTADAAGTAAAKTKQGVKTGAEKTGELAGEAMDKTKAGLKASADAVGDAAATAEVNLSAKASERFDNLDSNDDGVISESEARVDPKIADAFETADEDDNGRLTKAEFKTALDAAAED